MMWWHNGWGGVAWLGFAMIHVLFWAVLIAGVVMLLRGRRAGPRAGDGRAIDIVRERYARGEIDKQEFEEKMQALKT